MNLSRRAPSADELLDEAADAVARNDWVRARELARAVLQQARHAEAELIVRTADAFAASAGAGDPLAGSRDLRFMSILFCDVVGSSRLAHQLGDTRWRDTLERFRRRCARAVRRYDGYVHEASGDEMLVLFGYPRIREDDARRAVLAGLDTVSAVHSLSALLVQECGIEFRVRVGVHTGRALIGDSRRVTDQNHIGGSLFGQAANVAKAIESSATPDSVWVSADTRRIVEGFFDFASGPGQLLTIGPYTVRSYEVLSPTAAINRHQIARVRSDEVVGRVAERAQLTQLWERASRHGGPMVVVSGPAGIGKSRLVEFVAETAAGDRGNRLECVCVELLTPVAFAPVSGLLERFANIRPNDDAHTRLSKLTTSFGALSPEFDRVVPYLAWMMSIPVVGDQEIAQLEPEAIRARIFDILVSVLALSAKLRPLVLWIEDVQWADHSTHEFCRHLQARGPIPGLLVVATWRADPEEARGELPWSVPGESLPEVVRINLGALSAEESCQLIAARAEAVPARGWLNAVLETTGGNPLYIEEVVRANAATKEAPNRPTASPRHSISVPERLHPIFAPIVDRLGEDRHVAQLASLLGRELPEPLTRTVVASILGLDQSAVVRSLERLIEADVVEPHLTGPTSGYRFRHELIRESLVESIGPDVRQNHARIADAIEQWFPDVATEQPARLAFHRTRADQHEQAAAYQLQAGMRLQARAAHQEAIAAFDEGLDSLSRLGANARPPKLELGLRASRGVSIQTVRGYSDTLAGQDWARAYELSKQLAAETDLVPALLGLWSFYFVKGEHGTAIDVAEQMLDVASALSDPEASLIGQVSLGYSQFWRGDLVRGRDSAERGLELRQVLGDRPSHIHIPQDPALAGLSLLAPARWTVGDQLGGIQAAEESERLANNRGHKWAINVARVGQYVAWLHQIRRAPVDAREAAERALAVSRAHGIDWAVVNLSIHQHLALAHEAAGGPGFEEAVQIVRAHLGYWRASGAETMVPYFLGQLAEAFRLAGRHGEALDVANEALALAEHIGERCHDAELFRIRGEARLALGDRDDGLRTLHSAVAIAEAQHALSFEVRAIVALMNALGDHPDRLSWASRLQAVLGRQRSHEHGPDERAADVLVAQV